LKGGGTMSKSIEELTVEIVVAAINSNLKKTNKSVSGGLNAFTTDDIPALIKEVYDTLKSLDSSDSE